MSINENERLRAKREKQRSEELMFLDEEDELVSDIDEGWAWVILLGAFLAFAVLSGLHNTSNIYFLVFVEYFGRSKSVTAAVGSTYTAVFFLGGPLATIIILKWGCRFTIMSGGVIAAVGFILASVSNSIEALIFTQGIIAALGLSMNYAGWIIALGMYFQKKHSLGTGLAMTGFGVGLFFLGPLMQANVEFYTWRGSFIINAGLALHFCVFGALVFPITQEQIDIYDMKMEIYELQLLPQPMPEIVIDGETKEFSEHPPRSVERSPTTPTMYSPLASFLSHSVRSISEASKTPYSSIFSSRRASVTSFTSLPGNRVTHSLENLDFETADDCRIRSNSMVEKRMRRYTVGTTTKQDVTEPVVIVKNGEESEESGEPAPSKTRRRTPPAAGPNLLEIPSGGRRFSHIAEGNEDDVSMHDSLGEKPSVPLAKFQIAGPEGEENMEEMFEFGDDLQADELPPPEQKKCSLFMDVIWSPSLFKDARLWCFAFSGFAWMLGTFTMFILYKDIASSMGVTERWIYALSGFGIGDMFGRLFAATISSWAWVNNVLYYGLSQLVCGIVILQHVNIATAEGLIMMCVLLGATYGQQNVLLAVAPAHVYGPQNLTTVFGYVLLFCGLGVLLGPPVAGRIAEIYDAYNIVYIMAGVSTLIGSFLTILCYFIDNKRLREKLHEMFRKLRSS